MPEQPVARRPRRINVRDLDIRNEVAYAALDRSDGRGPHLRVLRWFFPLFRRRR